MSKLLLGGFVLSSAYLSYKVYFHMFENSKEKLNTDEELDDFYKNYEKVKLQLPKEARFPPHLELKRLQVQMNNNLTPSSLCESLEIELKRDWNSFIYQLGRRLINH